jgi:hypothetical protein
MATHPPVGGLPVHDKVLAPTMNNTLAYWLRQRRPLLTTPQDSRRVLAFAQPLTHGTRIIPTPAEKYLLDQFVREEIWLDQLLASLESTTVA